MSKLRTLWESTVGKKAVMAVTGIIMILYLLAHVSGNLLIFGGPESINGYAALLHRTLPLLWFVRTVLLVSIILHILAGYQLTRRSWAARPVAYQKRVPQASTWASRSMRTGGVAIALFVTFHILHLTTGTIQPAPYEEGQVFDAVVGGFRIWWVVVLDVIAMAVVGLHVFHGAWASFRTMGVSRPSPNPLFRSVATIVAGALWIGFTLVPVAIAAGVLSQR
jgi:succinate dehydrogenase / fumarate reductase cytochrome b subunit